MSATHETDDFHTRLLFARLDRYTSCMERLRSSKQNGLTLDFHFIKFSPNHVRKEHDLIKALVAHIVTYTLKEPKIREMLADPVNTAVHDAMGLFTQRDASGEAGELLLYVLMELFLRAPQILAKMSLKTSAKLEYNGADGVHFRYNGPDQPLDIYLGESKIWETASSAIDDALDSIEAIRAGGFSRELVLATENFKWIDAEVRDKIFGLLDPDSTQHDCRISFVALVGFDLPPHGNRKTVETLEDFKRSYQKRSEALETLTLEKLQQRRDLSQRTDDIIHIFYVPFNDVEAFRADFVQFLTTGRFEK
jgi:hypothetical protein